MTQPTDDTPMIRGAFIKDARNWSRTAYGAEAYRSALAKLTEPERAFVDGLILPASWYPIATWDRFLDAMRAEASARKGDSPNAFDMRNMREGGGSLLVRSGYKLLLSLVGPTTAIDRAAQLFNRAYSEGRCDVIENVKGRAVVRYSGARPAFRKSLVHHLPTALVWVLEENGAPGATSKVSRDEVTAGKLTFEVTIGYGAR